MRNTLCSVTWGNDVVPWSSAIDVIDAANLTGRGVSNVARKLWTRVETFVRLLAPTPYVTTWDVRIYWKPSAPPPPPSFRRPATSNADSVAVTFNSRAQRRPICVVRTPITPDKARVIYLPSTRDAITRPLLTSLLRRRREGARRRAYQKERMFLR